jgi:hypothetical protein
MDSNQLDKMFSAHIKRVVELTDTYLAARSAFELEFQKKHKVHAGEFIILKLVELQVQQKCIDSIRDAADINDDVFAVSQHIADTIAENYVTVAIEKKGA